MAAGYFPRSDAGLLVWLQNFQAVLPDQAKALGIQATEVKEALDQAKELGACIQNDEQKYAEWQAAVAKTAVYRKRALDEIQRVIDRLKVSHRYTDETSKALMAVAERSRAVDWANIKPVISAQVFGNKVRVHWTRGALDGVNVYGRAPGGPWVLLGFDSRPPFDDMRPLPADAEVREYRAIGVHHDEEVGQPSDPASATVCR